MARWTFVRHGESTANQHGILAGHRDVPLTTRGIAEAKALADSLADVPFERILVSDLQRARETLRLALPHTHLPTSIEPGLRERTLGEWEGVSREKLQQQGAMRQLLQWASRPPNGESQQDLAVRVFRTLCTYDQPIDTVVFCHGGVLRVVLGLIDHVNPRYFSRHRYPNCALQTRSIEPGTWKSLWTEATGLVVE